VEVVWPVTFSVDEEDGGLREDAVHHDHGEVMNSDVVVASVAAIEAIARSLAESAVLHGLLSSSGSNGLCRRSSLWRRTENPASMLFGGFGGFGERGGCVEVVVLASVHGANLMCILACMERAKQDHR